MTSRLTKADVVEIVRLLKLGANNTEIAARFGASHATISLIRNGRTWANDTKAMGWKPKASRRGPRPARLRDNADG